MAHGVAIEVATRAVGFDFYLRKPVDTNALLALVAELSTRTRRAPRARRVAAKRITICRLRQRRRADIDSRLHSFSRHAGVPIVEASSNTKPSACPSSPCPEARPPTPAPRCCCAMC